MVALVFSTPSTSVIYGDLATTIAGALPTCGEYSLGQPGTPCNATIDLSVASTSNWYDGDWTTPAAWLIIVYCISSAATWILLMCHGYLDWRFNLDFSHAAAAQRELRRRRRNSRRLSDWNEQERRDAEEIETELDEEEDRNMQNEWVQDVWAERIVQDFYGEHEQQPTLYAGLADVQRDVMRQRQERDIRVLARLERAGLI